MTEKGTEHGDFEEIVQVRKYADHCVMTKRSRQVSQCLGVPLLDCMFTLFLLIVMFAITNSLITTVPVCYFMFLISIFRAVFDLLENSTLLKVLRIYPFLKKTLVQWCSWFTTIKFICLYMWIFACILKCLAAIF